MSVPPGEQTPERVVEFYASPSQLGTAVALRGIVDGWALLSAGKVRDGLFWAEYDRNGSIEDMDRGR